MARPADATIRQESPRIDDGDDSSENLYWIAWSPFGATVSLDPNVFVEYSAGGVALSQDEFPRQAAGHHRILRGRVLSEQHAVAGAVVAASRLFRLTHDVMQVDRAVRTGEDGRFAIEVEEQAGLVALHSSLGWSDTVEAGSCEAECILSLRKSGQLRLVVENREVCRDVSVEVEGLSTPPIAVSTMLPKDDIELSESLPRGKYNVSVECPGKIICSTVVSVESAEATEVVCVLEVRRRVIVDAAGKGDADANFEYFLLPDDPIMRSAREVREIWNAKGIGSSQFGVGIEGAEFVETPPGRYTTCAIRLRASDEEEPFVCSSFTVTESGSAAELRVRLVW